MFHMQERDNSYSLRYLKNPSIMPLGVFLVFVRITKWKSTTTYRFQRVRFTITYNLFHSLL